MGKAAYMKLKGSFHFRQRLLLATLSTKAILIEDIRSDETSPGLRSHEVSLLRLIEKISDDCSVEINETGTKLRYKPGVLVGGKYLVHDCGLSRSIGYFLEPLILLGLFGKKALSITLKEGLELKIVNRGAPPLGGGEIILGVPIVPTGLTATHWVDEGMVKSIRGVTFSTRVSPQIGSRMIYAARGIFNRFIPDVHIFTDHRSGPSGGRSPGYGVSLVAETTTGCLISTDIAISHPKPEDMDTMEDSYEKPEMLPPEDVGVQVASILLGEIEQGGVVDSTHQGLVFLLCALCPPDVSKVRVGKLTPYGIETLRNIRDFLDVKFVIKPDPTTNTVILKCVGCGMKNLSRKVA
ncbi:probable RNA 3'-terminal phosphate cyclase-like protein isoform X2 [Zingiber officinale]|uniref:probable RNA 3'-terminal phosphate cyclase-like protein isoform X2 n=1 Tax=Zingiber officinale TaxID=94328 RepID=UPI001C4C8DC0|nr:probable RNA 3'-terminal phosphate cyclase-like protein isoform X2 [Zingiber officinale]